MRRSPALLMLDELTVSEYTATEHALHEWFAKGSESVPGAAPSRWLVSHLIGSHDQLMALGGTYDGLYELEVREYR